MKNSSCTDWATSAQSNDPVFSLQTQQKWSTLQPSEGNKRPRGAATL